MIRTRQQLPGNGRLDVWLGPALEDKGQVERPISAGQSRQRLPDFPRRQADEVGQVGPPPSEVGAQGGGGLTRQAAQEGVQAGCLVRSEACLALLPVGDEVFQKGAQVEQQGTGLGAQGGVTGQDGGDFVHVAVDEGGIDLAFGTGREHNVVAHAAEEAAGGYLLRPRLRSEHEKLQWAPGWRGRGRFRCWGGRRTRREGR